MLSQFGSSISNPIQEELRSRRKPQDVRADWRLSGHRQPKLQKWEDDLADTDISTLTTATYLVSLHLLTVCLPCIALPRASGRLGRRPGAMLSALSWATSLGQSRPTAESWPGGPWRSGRPLSVPSEEHRRLRSHRGPDFESFHLLNHP